MATEYEVEQWKDLCEKVIMHNNELYGERNDAMTQYAEAEYERKIAEVKVDRLEWQVQELRAENAKLRELCADLYAEMITYSDAPSYNASVWAPKLRELGIEVNK